MNPDQIKAMLEEIKLNLGKAATAEEIKELKEEQSKLSKQLFELQQKASFTAAPQKREVVKSIGQLFVESKEFANFRLGQTGRARVVLGEDAGATTGASETAYPPITTPINGVPKDRQAGIIAPPYLAPVVGNLLNSGETASNMIEYLKEKSETIGAAETAEGAQKPYSSFEFETTNAPVRTIAHFTRITRQLADDLPALAAFIDNRMTKGVDDRVEFQIIKGDGTGQNLAGLFSTGNYTAHGYTSANKLTKLDILKKCIARLQASGYKPQSVLMNPLDWADLTLAKKTDGSYLLGNPAASTPDVVWGVPVVLSASVDTGKFMVGDFFAAATIYTRSGTVIEIFEQDGDNVQKNLLTIRAECRKALAVEVPAALIGGYFPAEIASE
ncbi:phage major capsid protein [Turicimonas muris]|uniref:phage major capsid protein n=1 Tax=Turicimonas muris TaxID=1796652 RepID=UPI00267473D7|nr:phage major capsid protein [Turicimonas muris]